MTSKESKIVESKEETATKSCQLLPGGFAGNLYLLHKRILITKFCKKNHVNFSGTGPNGSFFETPKWVDKSKAPGLTSQEPAVAPPGWWIDLVTGKFLFFSPNLVWLTIALFDYFVFPYDFQAAKSFQKVDWILYR